MRGRPDRDRLTQGQKIRMLVLLTAAVWLLLLFGVPALLAYIGGIFQ